MEVDEALGKLGTVGRWQVLYYTMISTACMVPSCFHMLAINYIGAWPEHHCKVADGALLNETIPKEEDGSYAKCKMYVGDDRNKTTACDDWQYFGYIGHTIVSEWDLVCDRAYLKDLTQTILIVGVMIGAVFCTTMADKFGRKPIFLFSQWAIVVVGVANAFAPNYYVFTVFRFFTGVFQQGIIMPSFVMACELFAAKYRTFAGTIIENFWAVATCFFALLAYLVPNWVHLQLAISLFGLLTVPLYWLLPESVVWLYAENRVAEAEQIIRNAAKLNNITMPDKILAQPAKTADGDGEKADDDVGKKKGLKLLDKFRNVKNSRKSEKPEDTAARYTMIDIFRNRHLTVNTLCMAFLWMVVTLVYYGLSLSAGQLAGNLYVNNFISGFVEIPAYTSSFFAMQKFGRRRPLITYYAISGIALVLSQVVPEQAGDVSLIPVRITFNMIGKFGISGAFAVVALYTPEIFPTTLRSQALGISSFAGRIGNLIAPFTSLMAKELPWLPGLLFGGLSTAAGLLTLLLPETLNRPLPQTIDDIEQWYSGKHTALKKSDDVGDQQEMSPMSKDQLNNDVVA